MKLADYLADKGLSQNAFAKRLKVSHVAVGRWISGERIPEPDNMRAILRETEGVVTPNDFVSAEAAA